MVTRGTILIREIYSTAVMHAIDMACLRLRSLPNGTSETTVAFARAVLDEMGKIVDAKKAYDDAVAAAEAAQVHEAEEHHAPKGTVLQ